MKVLIVEDDAALLDLWMRYLEPLGLDIDSATTLREALLKMSIIPFADLVFLDLVLPDSRDAEHTLKMAVEVIQRINPNAVIVVITGATTERIAELAAMVGVDGFRFKNDINSQRILLSAVQDTLASRRATPRGLVESGLRLLEKLDELLRVDQSPKTA